MDTGFYYLVQSGDLFCFSFVLKDEASSLPLLTWACLFPGELPKALPYSHSRLVEGLGHKVIIGDLK